MTASVSSWCHGSPCSTSASASISPAQCALPAASNGVSAGNGGWGYECPQCRYLLVAMGPDRRDPVKARAVRAPINPSVSNGRTEVEPTCSASAGPAGCSTPTQQGCAAASAPSIAATPLAPGAGTSRPRRGRVKARVASGQLVRTPGPDGRSIFTARTPDVPQVCDAAAILVFPSRIDSASSSINGSPSENRRPAERVHRSAARPGGHDR